MSYNNILEQAKLLQLKTQSEVYSLLKNSILYLEDIMNCINTFQPPKYTPVSLEQSNSLDSTHSSGVIPISTPAPTSVVTNTGTVTTMTEPIKSQAAFDELPICIMKNNKIVFAKASYHNGGKKLSSPKKQIAFIKKGQRGSKFRGVSKNGNQWQVLIMVKKRKNYFGSYDTEYHAARVYDLVAIQNYGNRAKTNFLYSLNEVNRIISVDFEDKKALKDYYSSV